MLERSRPAVILAVDDEDYNLFIIEEFLAADHHVIKMAHNGLEALSLLKAAPNKYDVVLLDRIMPEMDGMTLLAKMKADPELCNIPVILQTACAKHEEIVEGISAGAYYYVTKPYEEDMFRSVVQAAVKDCFRIKKLQHNVKDYPSSMRLMERGQFHYQTLEDCYALAALLANAFPSPETAIIGLTEIMINALEFGHAGLTYAEKTALVTNHQLAQTVAKRLALPENKDKQVKVTLKYTDNELIVTIEDQGKGFSWQQYLNFDVKRATDNHGRGIALANVMSFDHLDYTNGGTKAIAKVKIA